MGGGGPDMEGGGGGGLWYCCGGGICGLGRGAPATGGGMPGTGAPGGGGMLPARELLTMLIIKLAVSASRISLFRIPACWNNFFHSGGIFLISNPFLASHPM